MERQTYMELAARLETAQSLDPATEAEVTAALREAPLLSGSDMAEGLCASTDEILLLVDKALPGWAVSLDGAAREEHGDWICTLRRSRRSDDDNVIGIGRGEKLPHALLAAFLKTLALLR